MPERAEQSAFLPQDHDSHSRTLQEILDQHGRLSVEWNDLDKRAGQIEANIRTEQSQVTDIRAKQVEIERQIDEPAKP